MRSILLIAVSLFAFGSSGCAGKMAESGYHLSRYKTLDEVQATFGKPEYIEENEEYRTVYYHTRKKLADPSRAWTMYFVSGCTAGLTEFIFVPLEVLIYTGAKINGHVVTFTIDSTGKVVAFSPDPYANVKEASEEWQRKEKMEKEAGITEEPKSP